MASERRELEVIERRQERCWFMRLRVVGLSAIDLAGRLDSLCSRQPINLSVNFANILRGLVSVV